MDGSSALPSWNALDSSTLLSRSAPLVLSAGEESIEDDKGDEDDEDDERQSIHRNEIHLSLAKSRLDTS